MSDSFSVERLSTQEGGGWSVPGGGRRQRVSGGIILYRMIGENLTERYHMDS